MTDVREAAQNLIEYAIHRSMIGQDDRIWAYNTILECIGATGLPHRLNWAGPLSKLYFQVLMFFFFCLDL